MKNEKHRPYQLVAYDPTWPEQFIEKKNRILKALSDSVVAIHHMGGTSIPSMITKPQIDILVVVNDLQAAREKASAMIEQGFVAHGDYTGINEEYFTEDTADGKRLTSIHVLGVGHPQIEKILIFRDHLMKNKEDRDLYISVKKELYNKYADNYPQYTIGKEVVILEIIKRAEQK